MLMHREVVGRRRGGGKVEGEMEREGKTGGCERETMF